MKNINIGKLQQTSVPVHRAARKVHSFEPTVRDRIEIQMAVFVADRRVVQRGENSPRGGESKRINNVVNCEFFYILFYYLISNFGFLLT